LPVRMEGCKKLLVNKFFKKTLLKLFKPGVFIVIGLP
jgi:hypothetical protein